MGYLIHDGEKISTDELFAGMAELGEVARALVREISIRQMMAQTGEGRQIVADQFDALTSMDEEGVLDLTDGAPTTLADGLARYVAELGKPEDESSKEAVIAALGALLNYPWPEPTVDTSLAIEVRRPDDEHLEIWIGGVFVLGADYDGLGWRGMGAVESAARHVHRAMLSAPTGLRS